MSLASSLSTSMVPSLKREQGVSDRQDRSETRIDEKQSVGVATTTTSCERAYLCLSVREDVEARLMSAFAHSVRHEEEGAFYLFKASFS